MQSILGLLVMFCVMFDSAISASTYRRRPNIRDEPFVPAAVPSSTPEIIESSTVRRRALRFSLPSNATSIRSEITESFSCEGRAYGYYADVDNDCQVFHVCLPVTYPTGRAQEFQWSFICPEQTRFNQEAFTCVQNDDMPFDCAESERFYDLNRFMGIRDEGAQEIDDNTLDVVDDNEPELRISDRRQSLRSTSTPTPSTTSTTTTTSPTTPSTTTKLRTTQRRTPIFRRSTTKAVRQPTLPPSTTTEFTTTTEDNTTPTNFFIDLTESTEREELDDSRTTTDAASTAIPAIDTTTFEVFVSTEREPIARIVPALIEVGGNAEKIVDQSQAKITDDVVQNIKQLQFQNLFPLNARTDENAQTQRLETLFTKAPLLNLDDERRKRFLFKADAIEKRRQLFNRLNPDQTIASSI